MALEEENSAEETEAPKKSKLPLIIGLVIVLLLVGGGAAFFLMGSSGDGEPRAPVERIEQVRLAPFIVNLSDNLNYLRTVIVLEYDWNIVVRGKRSGGGSAEGTAGAGGEFIPSDLLGILATRAAHIRDAIITVLSSKTASEVLSVEGKEILREELLDAVNDALDIEDQAVLAVYFLEFVVQ